MAGETPPPPGPSPEMPPEPGQPPGTPPGQSPFMDFLNRLKISGKLILIAAFVGIICSFLPLNTWSAQANTLGVPGMPETVSSSASRMLIEHAFGILSLLGYLGAIAVGIVFYLPNVIKQPPLHWIAVGVCGLVGLFALLLLIPAFSGTGSVTTIGGSASYSAGFGVFVNLIAAGVVVAGGVIKAREEKLF